MATLSVPGVLLKLQWRRNDLRYQSIAIIPTPSWPASITQWCNATMGIHGILKEIGPGERISLAKVSADHYTTHHRCFRLAIDISIWLFQIQSGKGGSNPALRTFYYRLLRLLSLNVHPLFVFDGPNKPLFKRNKKVGGPGVRVATVPEFLAKQLLKHFGFPWHVAPGEAEAECALLQREGVIDAVLSEDVDTLMFGSGLTLRNWSAENSTKSPTHVNVYRAAETKDSSGLDRDGMILVALMSGGDYLPEGIPGCGPKVACAAARAGFGADLCKLGRKDMAGLKMWKERLQHQIRTNEAKHFNRRKAAFSMPDDFPNLEVLGYYTHPCVSTPERVEKLRRSLQWDQEIDFPALRTFTADAFDWRCLGGARKFIKNLAPSMLVRELRRRGERGEGLSQEAQKEQESDFVSAICGKRNHSTTDGLLEYRILFTPANFVPIDLSLEDEDNEFLPAGGAAEEGDEESEFANLPRSTHSDSGSEAPSSPTKRRQFRPFDPSQPDKLWMLRTVLQLGCPLLVEEYDASFHNPKAFFEARRKARGAQVGKGSIRAKPKRGKKKDMPDNALMQYAKVTRTGIDDETRALKELSPQANVRSQPSPRNEDSRTQDVESIAAFKLPSTQIPAALLERYAAQENIQVPGLAIERPFARFTQKHPESSDRSLANPQRTPRRKRRSPDLSSPAADRTQRCITLYYSPTSRSHERPTDDAINLISSPVVHSPSRPLTPTPPSIRHQFLHTAMPETRTSVGTDSTICKLPDSVTKRRKKGPLKRCQTAAVDGADDLSLPTPNSGEAALHLPEVSIVDAIDLASPSPSRRQPLVLQSDDELPSPNSFLNAPNVHALQRLTLPGKASADLPSSLPTPPAEDQAQPPSTDWKNKPAKSTRLLNQPMKSKQSLRRSSRQQAEKRMAIQLRESLEGAWKEVEAETLDLTGDGSGWKASKGRAKLQGWRKNGVEILDLTGA